MERTLMQLQKLALDIRKSHDVWISIGESYNRAVAERDDASHALNNLIDELDNLNPDRPWSRYVKVVDAIETEINRLERKRSDLEYDLRRVRNGADWSRDEDERSCYRRKQRYAEDELSDTRRKIEWAKDRLEAEKRKLGEDSLDAEGRISAARHAVDRAAEKMNSIQSQLGQASERFLSYKSDAKVLARRLFALDPSIKNIHFSEEENQFIIERKPIE